MYESSGKKNVALCADKKNIYVVTLCYCPKKKLRVPPASEMVDPCMKVLYVHCPVYIVVRLMLFHYGCVSVRASV